MKNRILTIIAVLLAFVAGGELTYLLFNNDSNTVLKANDDTSTVYNSCSNCMSGTMVVENGGIRETVSKVYDAVVMIKNYSGHILSGSGSGFVYKVDDKYGYILTNQHVVDDASKLTIVLASNEEVDGELLGGDKFLDVAVIRIPKEKVISIAKIGTTEDLKLGDTVVAIGTPVGEDYYNTVTGGYISGLNRKVTVSVETKSDWVQDVIQIDASINPGNSGGALVNVNGEVIGITSLKLVNSSIEGMGFAIKIDDVMQHIDELEDGKKIERPLLGISHVNITESYILSSYDIEIDSSIKSGVVVVSVEKGSSADLAGIKSGDVITEFDDEPVKNVAHLRYLLYKHKIGETAKITYVRGSKEKTTEIKLVNVKE